MEIAQVEIIRTIDSYFVTLKYEDGTSEEFDIVRSSIAWPHEAVPGLFLMGGLPRGTEVVKVLEERPFKSLSEARRLILDRKVKYSKALSWVYYQDIPEGEGFAKTLTGRDEYFDPRLKAAPYSESIDYLIQVVGSSLDDNEVKVPAEGILATELQVGWENVTSEKHLNGVIALGCLISGIRGRFEGLFSEDLADNLWDYPPEYIVAKAKE